MSRLLKRLGDIPSNLRWGGLLTLVLLLLLGGWFFFLRGDSALTPVTPPLRPAVGKTVTLADYELAIQDALSETQSALSASGTDRETAVKSAIANLEKVEGAAVIPTSAITTTLAEIDNTVLLRELALDDPNLEAVESSLTLLSDSLQNGPAGHRGPVEGTQDGTQALQTLATVLNNPVYDYNRSELPLQQFARWLSGLTGSSDPDGVLSRLMLSVLAGFAVGSLIFLTTARWIPNRWARLGLSTLSGIIAGSIFYLATDNLDIVFQVLTAVGLVAVAVAAGLILAGLNRGSAPGSVHPVSDLASVLGMSASEARQRAIDAAAEGDYRGGIRYRCLAVLLALDEAGMLVFDRTATNREYLFKAPGPLQNDLQLLLGRFEAIWYGNSPTNAEEWAQYTTKAATIESQITPTTRPKAA